MLDRSVELCYRTNFDTVQRYLQRQELKKRFVKILFIKIS